MALRHSLRFMWVGLGLALTVAGCATVAVQTEGEGQRLRWHATDFRSYRMGIDKRELYEYTLVLEERQGSTITFTALEAEFRNNVQSRRSAWRRSGHWVLPAHGELRLPLGTYRQCRLDQCRDWGPLAPIWRLMLRGTDEQGQVVREVIEMTLPSINESS